MGDMAKTIAAVDDSSSIRQAISFELEQAGYEVITAEDGMDALVQIAGKEVDLVITDLNMPKLDGIGLIKKLREDQNYKFTPIIMLTTESEASKKEEGKQAGATAWMTKPFKSEQLLGVIRKVIG